VYIECRLPGKFRMRINGMCPQILHDGFRLQWFLREQPMLRHGGPLHAFAAVIRARRWRLPIMSLHYAARIPVIKASYYPALVVAPQGQTTKMDLSARG
jgi:hypothetical protein